MLIVYLYGPKLNKLFYIVLCLIIFCHQAKAQENLKYSGPLKIGAFSGDANYYYKVIAGDTLLDGSFRLKKSNLDALLQKQDSTFDFSGNFSNNYPNGFWDFKFGEFQSNKESQVVDYQYRIAVDGTQEEASGNIIKGKPDGTWNYIISKIENSKVSQSLFKSSISFNKGVPQKTFRIENDSLTLAGRFLRNGLAHDEWSLFESFGLGASESWRFDDGLLEKIERNEDGTSKSVSIYGSYRGQTKTINLDKRYIAALAVYQFSKSSARDSIGGNMKRLLAQNAGYYAKIDSILSELGESSFLPEFKVKVPYFPFSKDELQLLDSIKTNYTVAKEISDAFLKNSQLNILKLSNEDAAFQYEVIKKIAEDFLEPVGVLLQYHTEEVAELAPRSGLIENLWRGKKPEPSISVVFEINDTKTNRDFNLENSSSYNFNGTDLKSIFSIVKYAKRSLFSINEELRQKLNTEKRQEELVLLEEQLVKEQQVLDTLIDSVRGTSPPAINKTLEKLKEFLGTQLSDYASMPNTEAKLQKAKELALCANQIDTLSTTIVGLPEKEKEIKQKYQDRIWNPYTATLMDEQVKKRITSAYLKILAPYFLDKAQQDFKCSDAEELNSLINNTYRRMLELREEDTSKLERKLRRQADPQAVFGLFEIEPNSKEK